MIHSRKAETRNIGLEILKKLVKNNAVFKDIDLLEKMQRRATRMMANKSLSYYDRLKKFGLTTLETRRLRGDLIEVYKLFKGYDGVDFNVFFQIVKYTFERAQIKNL